VSDGAVPGPCEGSGPLAPNVELVRFFEMVAGPAPLDRPNLPDDLLDLVVADVMVARATAVSAWSVSMCRRDPILKVALRDLTPSLARKWFAELPLELSESTRTSMHTQLRMPLALLLKAFVVPAPFEKRWKTIVNDGSGLKRHEVSEAKFAKRLSEGNVLAMFGLDLAAITTDDE